MTGGELRHRHVTANGIRVHFVEQGQGFPVVLCHGFPELWYSWRHQVPALAAAGLRAIVPDLRGYGETDKPTAVEDYDAHHLAGDLVGLLDALELEKAVIVGHDWGSIVVWVTALMHPERVERVVSLNVPYRGHAALFPPIRVLQEAGDERFNYVVFFQEPGLAEGYYASDLPGNLMRTYQGVAHNKEFLSPDEFQVFLAAFEKGGLSGPLNFYRNIDRNCEIMAPFDGRQVPHPTLMITADNDPILRPEMAEGMESFVPDLCVELVRDCGHWTQQEKPQEVNRLLLDFLSDLAR